VTPSEAPDDRPVPAGPGAARELAEFLVPAPLVPGYEAVVALATSAHALDRLIRAPQDAADRRRKPVVTATRFAPVLGRLDPGQLTTVRHVCLTMVANPGRLLADLRGLIARYPPTAPDAGTFAGC
jgi:hypothetical protein